MIHCSMTYRKANRHTTTDSFRAIHDSIGAQPEVLTASRLPRSDCRAMEGDFAGIARGKFRGNVVTSDVDRCLVLVVRWG